MTAQPPTNPPRVAAAGWDTGSPSLPRLRGQDRVTALVRDPHTLFVYWTLNGPLGRTALAAAARRQGRWLLRLTEPEATRDIRIDASETKLYVPVDSNTCYRVAVGFASSDGFFPVAESTYVTTPRSMPSAEREIVWAYPKARGQASYLAAPIHRPRALDVEAYLRALEQTYGFPVASGS